MYNIDPQVLRKTGQIAAGDSLQQRRFPRAVSAN
jgi:hypothetical protein